MALLYLAKVYGNKLPLLMKMKITYNELFYESEKIRKFYKKYGLRNNKK